MKMMMEVPFAAFVLSSLLALSSFPSATSLTSKEAASSSSSSSEQILGLMMLKSGATLKDVFSTSGSKIIDPGTSLSLKCTASGNPLPQVTWTLDGSSLHESTSRVSVGDFVTKTSEVVSYVNISSVTVEDGGVYACQAANEISSIIHSGRIDVKGDPAIRPMKDKVAIEGQHLLLNCPFAGYPIDEVYWEHNNRRLPYNHRQRSFPNGSALIDSVDRRTDGGEYRCVVRAPGAKVSSKTVKVSIESPPVIEPFSFPRFLEEGSRAKILCSVIKGDPPITIRWLKDGRPLTTSPMTVGVSISTLDEFSSAIVMSKVSLGHRGNYTCIASNAASSSNYTAEAVVYAPPRWILEPQDTIGVTGREVMLHCLSEGFPDPVIEWKRSTSLSKSIHSLSSSSSSSSGLDGSSTSTTTFRPVVLDGRFSRLDNATLEIKHVDKSDEGYYMCKASNGIGSGISTVVHLAVKTPAHFKEEFRVETVAKSSPLTITCEAIGDKPLTISWKKDGQAFVVPSTSSPTASGNGNTTRTVSASSSHGDRRYTITETLTDTGLTSTVKVDSADRRDSSLYTCLTSNAYGSDEINLQVIVQEKPDPPSKATVTRVDSRSITLSWSPPYTGNSPLLYYIIEFKEVTEEWSSSGQSLVNGHTPIKTLRVPGSETRSTVTGLFPGVAYHLRIYAENSIGRSDSGPILHAITEIEAPSDPPSDVTAEPLGSKAIRVSWRPPTSLSGHQIVKNHFHHQINNLIKGYYVGFRAVHSPHTAYSYKTVEVPSNDPSSNLNSNGPSSGPKVLSTSGQTTKFLPEKNMFETVISNLERLTKYVVVVKAFNRKGSGPPSEEVYVKTNDLDIPPPPVLELVSSGHKSLEIKWEIMTSTSTGSSSSKSPLTGFTINIREEGGLWKEISIGGELKRYILTDLLCGTKYQVYLTARNEAGSGLPSNTVSTRTHGTVPIAPSQSSFLRTSGSSVLLHFSEWQSGGCSVKYFLVQFRSDGNREWQSLPQPISGEQDKYLIKDLTPDSWYRLRVSSSNDAGTTEAEYTFSTSLGSSSSSDVQGNLLQSMSDGEVSGDGTSWMSLLIMPLIATITVTICILVTLVSLRQRKPSLSGHGTCPSHPHHDFHHVLGSIGCASSVKDCSSLAAYSTVTGITGGGRCSGGGETLPLSERRAVSLKTLHSSDQWTRTNLYDSNTTSRKEARGGDHHPGGDRGTTTILFTSDHPHHPHHWTTTDVLSTESDALQEGQHHGTFRVAVAASSSPSHLNQQQQTSVNRGGGGGERNYEVPFLHAKQTNKGRPTAFLSSQSPGEHGMYSFPTSSRIHRQQQLDQQSGSGESSLEPSNITTNHGGGGNIVHVRLNWPPQHSQHAGHPSSTMTPVSEGSTLTDYESVRAQFGSTSNLDRLDNTIPPSWDSCLRGFGRDGQRSSENRERGEEQDF